MHRVDISYRDHKLPQSTPHYLPDSKARVNDARYDYKVAMSSQSLNNIGCCALVEPLVVEKHVPLLVIILKRPCQRRRRVLVNSRPAFREKG
jgi:hypothetical protein